jgi:hypothetical protein
MLAQSFKSAIDLDITQAQLSALIKTLVLLETGKLKHVPASSDSDRIPNFSGHFNMCNWAANHDCGTIACIGGTAEMVGEVSFGHIYNLHNINRKLSELFLPPFNSKMWHSITTEQAATALRSYLTIGDARWDLAVT